MIVVLMLVQKRVTPSVDIITYTTVVKTRTLIVYIVRNHNQRLLPLAVRLVNPLNSLPIVSPFHEKRDSYATCCRASSAG